STSRCIGGSGACSVTAFPPSLGCRRNARPPAPHPHTASCTSSSVLSGDEIDGLYCVGDCPGNTADRQRDRGRGGDVGQKFDAGHGENAFHFLTSLLASQHAIPKKPTRQPTVHTARNAGWFSKMVTPNTAVSMIRTPEKNAVTPPPRAVSPARRQWPPR